jgi:hypothetical protein
MFRGNTKSAFFPVMTQKKSGADPADFNVFFSGFSLIALKFALQSDFTC